MAFNVVNRLASLSPVGLKGLSPPPLAIDFGTSGLKILQIAAGEPPSLVAAACLDTPDDLMGDPEKRLSFQIEALPKLIRSAGFKSKRAVCAIPAGQTLCKHMQFQKSEGVSIGALVRMALPMQLGCDASALVFRHVEVGEVGRAADGAGGGAPKTEVICMAVARDLVDRLMGAIKAARLAPVGMHCEYLATLKAFDSITRRAQDTSQATLYLDIGAGTTKVMIAHGRDLVFARGIEHGGLQLDEAVAHQLHASLREGRRSRLAMTELARAPALAPQQRPRDESGGGMALLAAAMKKDGADEAPVAALALATDRRAERPPGEVGIVPGPGALGEFVGPQADLTEPLEILTDEIAMCLRYHESLFPDRRVDRALFIGGEARHRGLCQHIAKTLRLAAQIADPLARVARTGKEPSLGVDLRGSQPGWAVALGLSLSPTDL